MTPKEVRITQGGHDLEIEQQVNLAQHSTMRVGGPAKWFVIARNAAHVQRAYNWAAKRQLPNCTIGSGSNIIWPDDGYNGLVVKNDIRGFDVVSQTNHTVKLRIGAGEILDRVVERTTRRQLSGMECLSLIPGTCGGAVIQNSGAYGQEISQVLESVEVYDTQMDQVVVLSREACNLGYRSSRFKNDEPGRFVVLGLTVRLHRCPAVKPSYPALQVILGDGNSHTPAEVRTAVISVRRKKLPDPETTPNCGSFFTNPTVFKLSEIAKLRNLQAPIYAIEPGKFKVPAAWLIEQCGLKDHADAELGFGTWPVQPLVIYAMRHSSCDNLLQYSAIIETAVQEEYGIILEREPVLMRTLIS